MKKRASELKQQEQLMTPQEKQKKSATNNINGLADFMPMNPEHVDTDSKNLDKQTSEGISNDVISEIQAKEREMNHMFNEESID